MHDFAHEPFVGEVPLPPSPPRESLIVLTRDPALVSTLKVLGSAHEILRIGTESDLPEALLGRHTGVAILDAAAASTPIERLAERLKAQFPDLVLIVTGRLDHQGALNTQITNGTVYRFLHKPVSEQRVKLFVEAAWRRHEEQPVVVAAGLDPTGKHRAVRPSAARHTWAALGIVLCAVVAVGWIITNRDQPASKPTAVPATQTAVQPRSDAELESLLSRADSALARGALVSPPGENAAELFAQAQRRNGSDSRPASGLEKVIEQLLSAAEVQVTAQHIDEAQKLVDQARAIKPDHVRVAFISARIAKERERAVLTQARRAASNGNVQKAIAVLDGAARDGGRTTLVAETRQELEQKQQTERVNDYLTKADQRIRSGQLLEPAEDNARFYVESARALSPDDPAVHQAERQLSTRLTLEARNALAAGNAEGAQRWIQAASDYGAGRDEIDALTHEQQKVQAAVKADALARLALLFNQRMTQGRVLDPPTDSAQFYLTQLVESDAAHPSTLLARQVMSARAVDEARAAVTRHDLPGASRWLTEARAAGAGDAATSPIDHDIKSAQDAAGRGIDPVAAGSLEQTHYSAPVFPLAARERGISGWVDLQFVVQTDGTVADVAITAAEPVGIFEQAAKDAVRKWRYRPVIRDGKSVDQRARVRLKFALEK